MVVGALVGGVLWRVLGASGFLVLVALLGGVAVGLYRVPQPRRSGPAAHLHSHQGARVDPAVTARYLLSARLVAFLSWFISGVNLAILPKLADEIHMPASQTGLAIAAFYAAVLLFFWVTRTSGRWQYRRWPLALPVPLALVGMAGLAVAHSVGPFMLACFIAGVATALSASTALYYALHGREEDLAHSTAIHEAVVGIGGVAGSVISGVLAEALTARLGLEPALRDCFVMAGGVAAVIGVAQIVAWKVMARPGRAPRAGA
jgi:MFS family permease